MQKIELFSVKDCDHESGAPQTNTWVTWIWVDMQILHNIYWISECLFNFWVLEIAREVFSKIHEKYVPASKHDKFT